MDVVASFAILYYITVATRSANGIARKSGYLLI